MTSRSFIKVIGALYHAVLNQNRNAVFIWSVEVCFLSLKINVILCDPFMKQLFYVIECKMLSLLQNLF